FFSDQLEHIGRCHISSGRKQNGVPPGDFRPGHSPGQAAERCDSAGPVPASGTRRIKDLAAGRVSSCTIVVHEGHCGTKMVRRPSGGAPPWVSVTAVRLVLVHTAGVPLGWFRRAIL